MELVPSDHKAKNIYYPICSRKGLLIPDLDDCSDLVQVSFYFCHCPQALDRAAWPEGVTYSSAPGSQGLLFLGVKAKFSCPDPVIPESPTMLSRLTPLQGQFLEMCIQMSSSSWSDLLPGPSGQGQPLPELPCRDLPESFCKAASSSPPPSLFPALLSFPSAQSQLHLLSVHLLSVPTELRDTQVQFSFYLPVLNMESSHAPGRQAWVFPLQSLGNKVV